MGLGYARLFAILANINRPARVKALATCCGMSEAEVGNILLLNRIELKLRIDTEGFIHMEAIDYE
ncbi:MAG: hypothetical protein J6L69_10455 [Lachnospiraceae bacterium]|nr:hypothetical protein [Lachnospiraceae bacterium]